MADVGPLEVRADGHVVVKDVDEAVAVDKGHLVLRTLDFGHRDTAVGLEDLLVTLPVEDVDTDDMGLEGKMFFFENNKLKLNGCACRFHYSNYNDL